MILKVRTVRSCNKILSKMCVKDLHSSSYLSRRNTSIKTSSKPRDSLGPCLERARARVSIIRAFRF